LSNSASVKGVPFAALVLVALLLAFAVLAGFVAVFTVISFFPRFEALLPHSAKLLLLPANILQAFTILTVAADCTRIWLDQASLKPCQ
jgi:hypothetical protein